MPAGVETLAEPLAKELARVRVLSVSQAVDIVRQLAHEVARQHETGRLYLHIAAETILYDSTSGQVALRESPDEARPFGGENNDDEFCPPELLEAPAVFLPVNIAAAYEALRSADLAAVDPRRVDLYQLGALLCRLLTGEGVSDFLSRPRVAAKVTPEIRDLIERALGHDSQRAFRSASELLRALDSLDAAITTALPNAQPGSTRNAAKPDTTPSFVGVGKADTDVGRPAPSPTNEAELPFAKLGHYEIVGRLGHGGMGDVYKGYEPQLDRQVAIKVLPAEFSRQEEMVKRFYAEASAAAKLVHPNTVEIHFIGQDEVASADGPPSKVHFFAMRFVEGESLADLLARRQRLNVDESLAIIEQALAGLSAAHRLGMVHRDIKPGNILIDRERQRVLLADFGLVKSLQAAASMTASGVIVGTVDYMAPEQGRGETVDARADLYAIGVVLYQMLSGRLPFQADSPTGMIFKHVYETPPSLHAVAPDVPQPLADIVSKLMSKSPDARYQTVEALLTDLKTFHQGQPQPSSVASVPQTLDRPRTVIIPTPRFAEEAVLPATLTQITTPDRWQRAKQAIRDFFLIPAEEFVQQLQTTENQVDGAIAEYERRHASLLNAVREAESVVRELETERDSWHRAIADAEQRAATPDDDFARATLAEKRRGERVLAELSEQLDSQQTQLSEMRHKLSQVTAKLESLRSQRDVLNARLKVARAQIRLAGGEVQTNKIRWLQGIRWINVALFSLVLSVLGVVAATVIPTLSGRGVFVSQLGRIINERSGPVAVQVVDQFARGSEFKEIYLNPLNVTGQTFPGCDRPILNLAVSPTGAHIAAATGDRTVFVWDAESGKLLHRLTGSLRQVNAVAFSPDGSTLVTGESGDAAESTLKLWNSSTGEFLGNMAEARGYVVRLAFAPKGPFLAVAQHAAITVWNFETRTVHWTISKPDSHLGRLGFSPDGSLLAVAAPRGEVLVWDVNERKLLKSWIANRDSTLGPLFPPDGSGLLTAFAEGSITKWNARTGEVISKTGGGTISRANSVALSNDGRWLAVANNQWITVLDAQSGLARAVFPGHQTTAVAFSNKGDRLFSTGGQFYLTSWDLNSPMLIGRGPSHFVSAGPLCALSPNKPLCLLNVGASVGIWNYEKRTALQPLKTSSPLNLSQPVGAFSQDSRQAAVLDGRRLLVWDSFTGELIAETTLPELPTNQIVPQLSFATDSEIVWIVSGPRLWRVDRQQPSAESWLEFPQTTMVSALSPDGRFVVAGDAGRLQAWETESRRVIIRGDEYSFRFDSLAFTRDGSHLLGLSGGTFYHWNLDKQDFLGALRVNERLGGSQTLAFLPDHRHVVSWGDPILRVFDIERSKEMFDLQAVPQGTTAPLQDRSTASLPGTRLQISYDGRFAVISAPSSQNIAFWNLLLHESLGKQPSSLSTGNSP